MSEHAKSAEWYVVHTYSGYENKVKTNLENIVKNRGISHLIQEIKVPTELVQETNKDGTVKESEAKVFPSYVFVKMIMSDATWHIVRNITGSAGFVGPEGRPVPGELYDESKLELKDKYSMFLGGNQPLCILRNENATTDKKLLVVRDSYSDSLAPFLAQDYAEVHLIDLRYYKMPLPMYVMQNGIDEALVLYSNSNFSTDNNLFMLGMG